MQNYVTTKDREALRAFKVLSSETRFKILKLLFTTTKDICVKEIAEAIGISHSATSHQLSKLEDLGLVSSLRTGQTVCYHPKNSKIAKRVARIIKEFNHIK